MMHDSQWGLMLDFGVYLVKPFLVNQRAVVSGHMPEQHALLIINNHVHAQCSATLGATIACISGSVMVTAASGAPRCRCCTLTSNRDLSARIVCWV